VVNPPRGINVFANLTDFKAALESRSPDGFVEHTLFDRVPHIFGGDRAQYVFWKRALAKELGVDAACLTIVGTAALGWSLNPEKNLKQFDAGSDVDVAVISPYHFTVAWRYLRTETSRRMSIDRKTRIAWDQHASNYVYWGTIATDRLLGILPFGDVWLKATTAMASIPPTLNRDIKFRVYNDFESLRSYQTLSVKKARQNLFKEGVDA
jgi:hypothetical protein